MKSSFAPINNWNPAARLVIYAAASVIFYFLSFQILSEYTLGDQVYYRAFYESLKGATFFEISRNQLNQTGSAEPLYGIVMWVGSNFEFDKDAYVSFFNTTLFLSLLQFLRLHRASAIFTFLIFSNFYMLVLATGAERLKFAYIAIILALLANRRLASVAFLSLSFLAHFQSFLIVIAYVAKTLAGLRLTRYVKKRRFALILPNLLFFLVFVVFIFVRFRTTLESKLYAYLQIGSIVDIVNILLLFAVAIITLQNKGAAIAALLTCLVFAFLLGPGRVNMIAVSIFILMTIQEKRTNHPLVIIIMIYFSIKGLLFVENIFRLGNGFATG